MDEPEARPPARPRVAALAILVPVSGLFSGFVGSMLVPVLFGDWKGVVSPRIVTPLVLVAGLYVVGYPYIDRRERLPVT